MSKRVVLTVSGVIPGDLHDQIAAGERPRADYVQLAEAMDADLLDLGAARRRGGRIGRLIERLLGSPVLLAWVLVRHRRQHDLVFTDGEHVGLPYAALCRLVRRRPVHFMIAHRMSVPKKAVLHRLLRLGGRIDRAFVYATAQAQFLTDELGYPAERVELTPFMVDTRYFAPPSPPPPAPAPPVISSVGRELRDYPTLMAAVSGLDARVVLSTASAWSRRTDATGSDPLPANVEVGRFTMNELRDLYARSALVVVPLEDVDFQAGVTAILEAMAMGKAVVCTRARGQTDVIVDGETGLYVPPADVVALRQAITRLLGDPAATARLGDAARRWAVEHADVDVYAGRLAVAVAHARDGVDKARRAPTDPSALRTDRP